MWLSSSAIRGAPIPNRRPPNINPVAGEAFLARAAAVSRACGVTRLADITGLDRIGLPVWQAVRPAGRAVSVHQGKGASSLQARLSALCEAIESHCAENAPADGPRARWEDLPAAARAPHPSDYARDRDDFSARLGRVRWCLAEDLVTGGECFLPHELVSLDFTRDLPSPFERASNGLGAAPSQAEALLKSLCELIERDAVGEWRRAALAERAAAALDPASVPVSWFKEWQHRLAELGISLCLFAPPSVIGVPVFVCWISGSREFGTVRGLFIGTAAHPDPESALFGAFAEAVQSRLTYIAAVRDDILPAHYDGRPSGPIPSPPAGAPMRWSDIAPGPPALQTLIERLVQAGYPQVAMKRLGESLEGVAVVKAFVPGLGTEQRCRRRSM